MEKRTFALLLIVLLVIPSVSSAQSFLTGVDVGLLFDIAGNSIPQDGDLNGTAEPDIGPFEHQV